MKNNLNKIDLFDLDIVNATRDDAVDALLAGEEKRSVAFVNAHCINFTARDEEYYETLKTADFVLPDGSGLQISAMMTGRRFRENLNGTDLFLPLCQAAARGGQKIFFLGGQPGIASKAADRAVSLVPELEIGGVHHGFFDENDETAVIDLINASDADILLVGLGVPQQDLWIARNLERLNVRVAIGVGAQFDFWSGRVSRAPKLLRATGTEWIWRLAVEPRRMARRYLLGNPLFLLRAARNAVAYRKRKTSLHALAKRALDLAISVGALVALSPLFILTALAIRLESRGPVFFRQMRVGQNGNQFPMLKFRSMYADAEARRAQLLEQSDRAGICFKAKADPRITGVGRWLRRFSIDELPQIINVACGNMSIVGPRPALPQEVAAYPKHALDRLKVKPGITGVWQVSGRADVGFNKMIDMDLAYVRSRSVLLDMVIVVLTARAVVSGRGAY